jgi:hypothetical protein
VTLGGLGGWKKPVTCGVLFEGSVRIQTFLELARSVKDSDYDEVPGEARIGESLDCKLDIGAIPSISIKSLISVE